MSSAPLRVLIHACRAAAHADRVGARVHAPASARVALRELLGGLAGTCLHEEERAALGRALYDATRRRARDHVPSWESTWFAQTLPQPPARVLVGGAGSGREAQHLERRGYRVDALEPAPGSAQECRARLADDAQVACASYESLSAAVLEGVPNAASPVARRSYDAALLGWTSLMHVTDASERLRLLRALDARCPQGPILLTFHPSRHARARGPGHRVGRALGSALRHLRSDRVEGADDALRFGVQSGFLRGLDPEELEASARAVGRVACVDGEDEGTLRMHLTRA